MENLREIRLFDYMRAVVEWIAGSAWRYFTLIFLLSFAIRVQQLDEISRRSLVPTSERELGAIAISLARSGEFANPYIIPTGATAHLPPIPPLIDSLIYRAFGLTSQAGYVRALFIILTASVLYGLLPWFSEQFGTGRPAGVIGGLIVAIGGLFGSIWDKLPGHGEFPTGLIMGLLLVAFLQRWQQRNGSWYGSLLLGLGIGIGFLVQPALLPVIFGCILFEIWWLKNPSKWAHLGVMTLGIIVACLPWGWRNYNTFEEIFFIRSNFGLELRIANNEKSAATFELMNSTYAVYRHPRADANEARLLIELGEIEYMRQAGREAVSWIRAHPAEFGWLTAQRFANLWFGPLPGPVKNMIGVFALTVFAIAGAWKSFPRLAIPQKAVLLIPLVTYPLIYYFVAYLPRYRTPIDWIIYILAGVAIWYLIGGSIGINHQLPETS